MRVGRIRYKNEPPKSRQKEETTKGGRFQGKHEKTKNPPPPPPISQGAYQIRKGEEHLKNT